MLLKLWWYTTFFLTWLICCIPRFAHCLAGVARPDSNTRGTVVSAKVERVFESVSPQEVQEAWLDYMFRRGGGLSLVYNVNETQRVLIPLLAQETITIEEKNLIEYKVTDMGPIWKWDLQQGSHFGQVRFVAIDDIGGSRMIWSASFVARQRSGFWQAVTQTLFEMGANNLESYLATPQLYTRTMKLTGVDCTPKEAVESWIDFVFRHGGGLPINPPLVTSDDSGGIEILRIPPFLKESVVSVDSTKVSYKVMNPHWFSYQVHSHLGQVRFVPISNGLEMIWNVEIRPYHGWNEIVKTFTSATVTILARNFKSHMQHPNAMVPLRPPRGGGSGTQTYGEVPLDSWLGGVLQAHLHDSRSTFEQTLSIFQPWTWGRSVDEDGEGAKWTSGFINECEGDT